MPNNLPTINEVNQSTNKAFGLDLDTVIRYGVLIAKKLNSRSYAVDDVHAQIVMLSVPIVKNHLPENQKVYIHIDWTRDLRKELRNTHKEWKENPDWLIENITIPYLKRLFYDNRIDINSAKGIDTIRKNLEEKEAKAAMDLVKSKNESILKDNDKKEINEQIKIGVIVGVIMMVIYFIIKKI